MVRIGDQGIITALGHPLRARILTVLDDEEASPKELAARFEEKLGNVSYHVRILLGLGLIELVRETPRRGAVEHHYRSMPRPDAVLNLDVSLDDAGWAELAAAVGDFADRVAAISSSHPGDRAGRVVAATLGG